MDRICRVFIILIVIVVKEARTSENIKCPKYCNCDLYEKLNRADCSEKKLISPNVDIPVNVEILDLSYNDISSLEDKSFEGLKYLLNLTLSHNSIHTIFLDAFIDLISLEHIDLSSNRLEMFDPRIFENNRKLLAVNLNENKFMTLPDQPFIISPTIQYLSLHQSQVVQITATQFTKMPLLSRLDLSDNLMITLNVANFMRLGQLKHLNVLNNHWTTCHSDLKSTVDYLRGKNVEVRINVCNFDTTVKKFERMMIAPPSETTPEPSEKDISYVWRNTSLLNNKTFVACNEENLEEICYLYESCNVKFAKLVADQTIQHYRSRLIDQTDPVYVALYSGLFLGFFITVSVVYVIYLICGSRYWKKRRMQKRLAERRRYMSGCGNNVRNPMPIPRPLRPSRPPLRTAQPLRHAINRANQREFLLARLFERPERHHHYNYTPNRIHHRVNNNLDTERLIRCSPPEELLSPISLAVQDVPAIRIDIPEPITEVPEPEPPRAETPPPAYNDIVK